MCDSYKASHARLYPGDLTHLYAYGESRGGLFPDTLFFGLQYYLLNYLAGAVITPDDIDAAEAFWTSHFGRSDVFDGDRWRRLERAHGGRLPLHIKAVPEGTVVPTGNVLFTVENTDPDFPFVTTFIETLLLKLWYPTTIATQSYHIRQQIRRNFLVTGSNEAGVDFACHDFGYRGVSSEESAGLAAAAHLVSFQGTDTVAGIHLLREFYEGKMSGVSIPATEHSVISAYGPEHEIEAYRQVLRTFPTGTVACVSDTYDIFQTVRDVWGGILRDEVLSRDGTLVIRPDSGDPNTVVPQVLEILAERFPAERNAAGFVVLDPHVRVIQGDGMDRTTIGPLYDVVRAHGFAAENLAVGSGGGLLQKVNRDTLQFAYKASEATYADGRVVSIYKAPVTDQGKFSKPGRLKLVYDDQEHQYVTGSTSTMAPDRYDDATDVMETVFLNGEMVRYETIDTIRQRVRSHELRGDTVA
jgi:nicotinamide phosphoribosyltransferase